VRITDNALVAAATMSDRTSVTVSCRQKGIDLVDRGRLRA